MPTPFQATYTLPLLAAPTEHRCHQSFSLGFVGVETGEGCEEEQNVLPLNWLNLHTEAQSRVQQRVVTSQTG